LLSLCQRTFVMTFHHNVLVKINYKQ